MKPHLAERRSRVSESEQLAELPISYWDHFDDGECISLSCACPHCDPNPTEYVPPPLRIALGEVLRLTAP